MEDEKKQRIARYLSALFAAILLICGFCLATIGILAEAVRRDYVAISSIPNGLTAIIITLACFLFAVGLLGLIGCYTQDRQKMRMFLYLSVMCICLQLLTGGLCYGYSEAIAEDFSNNLRFDVSFYRINGSAIAWDSIDEMQSKFKCCGYTNFLDWEAHPNYGSTNSPCNVPLSCCSSDQVDSKCVYYAEDEEVIYRGNVYSVGCKTAFHYWIEKTVNTMGITTQAGMIPQVVGALALSWLLQREDLKAILYTVNL